MRWISSTRKFKNGIERLWKRIHGPKVTVTEVQQNELSKREVDGPSSSSNLASSLKGTVDVPALLLPKKDDLVLWRKRHERRTFRTQEVGNSLGTIRAVQKMPHGHQAKWYRQSVKAGVKPEEPEDDT